MCLLFMLFLISPFFPQGSLRISTKRSALLLGVLRLLLNRTLREDRFLFSERIGTNYVPGIQNI